MVKVAPSILAADFTRLGTELAAVSEADMIHIDVMDGHFVPNITMGPLVVAAARRASALPLDVHLMIAEPERYSTAFAEAGAAGLTVHVEATHHLHRAVQAIRSLGVRPGVALNPATPLSTLEHVLEDVDTVLLMTVNPGFGGQEFIPAVLAKIRRLRSMLQERGLSTDIQVDGGIDAYTGRQCVEAGATILVAGTYVFGSPAPDERVRLLRRLAEGA